ncbi:SusC/RagA family TonB-linked outer membrane protein [Sphingobacterium litopenaei]|uniref:SusC/RagA family TonB-linked outer membrane protein n=1 Tax=Sphingobacterium litopenaei TaxID=2763500 RepID=A0ABR7YAA6_9SPHI|nr:SusC/RagA family TonB-linked outer membrane protein [Sphingobacterium litopenaei]MBD1428220.1 SusC/RagA family TonB-linked outer membrane protein [Sphingobacterium litopenaei]
MKQKLLSTMFAMTCVTSLSFAQTREVSGLVTSSDGTPISGASISIVGTNTATQTDGSGRFKISAPAGATLNVSFIGYVSQRVSIGNSSNLTIALQPNDQSLDEVVVIGYGSGRSIGSIVGSKTSITAKDIEGRPNANAIEALQGKIPGLSVLTSNGEPSATQSIRLHGSGSLGASSTPLFVVDGIPTDAGAIVSTNPDDWESITVLKDAAATSIYGARAANGVVYFKSKQGKIGERGTITARVQKGVNDLASRKHIEGFMTTPELLSFWVETGYRTQAQVDAIVEQWGDDTFDWGKYYYRENTGIGQYDINFSGGSSKTTYFISGSYYDQEGVMYRSGYTRGTLRSNLTTKVNDWVRLGLNLAGDQDKRESNGWGSNNTNGGLSLLAQPFYSAIDEDGNDYYDMVIPGLGRYSPKYLADMQPSVGTNQSFNPTAFLEVTPIKGLTLKSQGGMDYYNYRSSALRYPSYLGAVGNGTNSQSWSQGVQLTFTNTVDYRTLFDDIHDFSILLGQESTKYVNEGFSASGSGLTDDRLLLLGNTVAAGRGVGSSKSEYAYNSFFGRLGYSYESRYYLDFTLRNDASSRFGKNNRNATFWAIGGMWDVKKESFLSDVDWLNELRIKASIGTQGNSAIGNYQALATVGSIQYDSQPAWGVSSPGNPNLAWEEQTKTTVGVAGALFNRVNFNVEFYNRTTKNMLVSVPYPYSSGWSDITSNVGSLKNTGVDLELSFNVFKSPDYYFTPFINLNYNKQKITELFQGKEYWIIPNTGVSWAVGKPVEFFYPMQAGVNPETGLMQWYVPGEDITKTNNDPSNVTSTFNATALNQSTGLERYAPFIGGFGFASGYKDIFFDMDFVFNKGKYMINNDMYFFANPYNFAGYNQSKDVMDYWKNPGDVTKYPKYGRVNQFDDGLLEDASFLRLKNIRVGYNLPKSLLSKQNFFRGARLYYVGRNLFTSTKYRGPDPEIDSNLGLGVNPNTKQSLFGIELQF